LQRRSGRRANTGRVIFDHRKEDIMAYKIIPELCNGCGACESECPNRAISHVDKLYTIDPDKCVECEGTYDSPMCAELCNTDACVAA
jgi:ferredoxin